MSLGHLTVAENKKLSKTNRVNKMTQEPTQNERNLMAEDGTV